MDVTSTNPPIDVATSASRGAQPPDATARRTGDGPTVERQDQFDAPQVHAGHGASGLLDVAEAALAAASRADLVRTCGAALGRLLEADRVAILPPDVAAVPPSPPAGTRDLDVALTTTPQTAPGLLRIPLTTGDHHVGVLEIDVADAARAQQVRPVAERAARLIATRLADLRRRPEPPHAASPAAALDGLPEPVVILAPIPDGHGGVDGAEIVWGNLAHLDAGYAGPGGSLDDLVAEPHRTALREVVQAVVGSDRPGVLADVSAARRPGPPPAATAHSASSTHAQPALHASLTHVQVSHLGLMPLGELVIAIRCAADIDVEAALARLYSALEGALTGSATPSAASDGARGAVTILRPVHDADGAVVDFDVAWANRPDPTLGGAPLAASVRAATRRIASVDVFAQLRQVLDGGGEITLTGLDVMRPGATAPVVASCVDLRIGALGAAVVCAWHDSTDPDRVLQVLEEREHLFRTALDATLDPVTIVVPVHGADGTIRDFEMVWCNEAHLAGGGSRPGSSMLQQAHTIASVDIVDAHRRVYSTGEPMVIDDVKVAVTEPSGDVLETFVDLGICRFGDGLLTSYRPATDRVRAQHELQESERLFRSAFDDAPLGMVLFSLDETCLGRCLRVNAAYQELTGFTEEELMEGDLHLVAPSEGSPRISALLSDMAAGRVHRRRVEGRTLTASGTLIDTQIDVAVVTRGGRPAYGVAHVEDITERRRAESEISWLAMHDAVTGLPNRHLFLHHLQFGLKRLERRPGTLGVLLVDVARMVTPDRDSAVAVTEVARRLGDAVRRSDTPARLSVDEFAVLLPDVAGPDGADRLVQRVLDVLAPPLLVDDEEVLLQADLGIALTTSPDSDAEDLIRRARAATVRAG